MKNISNAVLLLALSLAGAHAKAASSQEIDAAKTLFSNTVQAKKPVSQWVAALRSKFGARASVVLKDLLGSDRSAEPLRWASLIGIARLDGKNALPTLKTYMTHPTSWLLRDAAIQSAAALNATELAADIESRLNDEALVVRTSAVDAIGALGMRGSSAKLVSALFDPANNHAGKALWIHRHILKVLCDFKYEAAVPRLKELARTLPRDLNLRSDVSATIRTLAASAR